MTSYKKCLLISAIFLVTTIVFLSISVEKIHEGYTSFSRCRAQGYTKEFCLQTPTTLWGPAGCTCPDGRAGIIHPGLRGECLCSRYY
jgi:hypothetical protein